MAELDLLDFVKSVRQTCDESELVTTYDIRILDNATAKVRVFLAMEAFIDIYFNPENGNCAFALIRGRVRIYGADNAFIGWHIHPFDTPDQHQPCGEVSFGDFLRAVEEWYRQSYFSVK